MSLISNRKASLNFEILEKYCRSFFSFRLNLPNLGRNCIHYRHLSNSSGCHLRLLGKRLLVFTAQKQRTGEQTKVAGESDKSLDAKSC